MKIQLPGPLEILQTKTYQLCISLSLTLKKCIVGRLSNLFQQNVATSVNHAEWAERPRSAQTGTARNTQALFIEACAFVFCGCVMHSNKGATSQSHSELLREYVKCRGNVFISVSLALHRSSCHQ